MILIFCGEAVNLCLLTKGIAYCAVTLLTGGKTWILSKTEQNYLKFWKIFGLAQAEFKARVHRFKTILYPTSAWVFMTTNSIYRRGAILFVPEILPLCRYNKAVLLRVCMYRWGNRSRMLSRELPGLLVCSACLINAGFVTVFELSEKCIFCFFRVVCKQDLYAFVAVQDFQKLVYHAKKAGTHRIWSARWRC